MAKFARASHISPRVTCCSPRSRLAWRTERARLLAGCATSWAAARPSFTSFVRSRASAPNTSTDFSHRTEFAAQRRRISLALPGKHAFRRVSSKNSKSRSPPLAEQRRIVAKLETLLGKVDASQQRLAKIPVLLKRFRQSVLAAACSGRLTADWREENPNVEAYPVNGRSDGRVSASNWRWQLIRQRLRQDGHDRFTQLGQILRRVWTQPSSERQNFNAGFPEPR